MNEDTIQDLSEMLALVLEQCLARGMQPPLHMAIVGVNGSMIFGRYTAAMQGGLDVEILAQHLERPGLALPINMMITDQTGEAFRVLIDKDRKVSALH